MRKFLDFKLLVIVFASFVFVNCNSDELNEDLPNEQLIENITGASFGKYQQLNLEEALGFVNDIKLERPSKGGGMGVRNADSDFLVGVDAGSLAFDAVEGTELKIPRLKARLKSTEVESTMFLIKLQDSTHGFLMNIVKDKDITDEDFSGIIGITDLEGKFINGYRVKNGVFISQFVVAKNQKPKDSVKETKSSLSYTTRTFLGIGWMSGTIHLEEVTVYASEEPSGSKEDDTDGLDMGLINYFGGGGYSFGFFGGSGSGSDDFGSGEIGGGKSSKEVFPCDDPINGCDEDDKIDDDELEGKAKCLNDLLDEKGNSFVKDIFSKFKGNSTFDIKIVSEDKVFVNEKEVNGATSKPINDLITIYISTTSANKRSALEVARTILHEYIHADIYRKLDVKYNADKELDFKKTYLAYKSQHEAMGALYITSLRDALRDFHKTVLTDDYNKYTYYLGEPSLDFYEALAWRGLKEHDVQAWKDLSPDRKQELDDIGLNIAYLTNSIWPNENE